MGSLFKMISATTSDQTEHQIACADQLSTFSLFTGEQFL